MPDYDIALAGGRVIDPESGYDKVAHVGVKDGLIAAVSETELHGTDVQNAHNSIVAPGFIDIHVHEDEAFRMLHDQTVSSRSIEHTGAALVRTGVTTMIGGNCGYSPYPLDGQFRANSKAVCNYGSLVGYNSLRDRFLDQSGDPAHVLERLSSEIDSGAFGVSFGLQYNPAITREELLAAAQLVHSRGGFIAAHLRYDYPGKAIESASEILDVAEITGVSAHISHIAANIYGDDNLATILERMRALRERGYDVTADTYPYGAWGTGLTSDVFSKGWQDRYAFTYEDIEIVSGPYSGRRCTPALFEKLRALREETFVVCHNATPGKDVDAALTSNLVFVACDGSLFQDEATGELRGHPRSAGTAAKVLGGDVRERGILSVTEAISKLSLEPAQRLNTPRKGRLREGMDADITVFNPATVADQSTFGPDVCATPPTGIDCVLIGGRVAYREGALTVGQGEVVRAG